MALIQSGLDSTLATVESTSKALLVRNVESDGSPLNKAHGTFLSDTDHFTPVAGVNDGTVRALRLDRFGGQALALNNLAISEAFEGTSIATHRLTAANTTFSPTQTNQLGYRFNPVGSVTAGAAALLYTNKRVARFQRAPIQAKWRARLQHRVNSVIELGLMGNIVTQTAEQTSGVCFQVTSGGDLLGNLYVNGSIPVQTVTLPALPVGWQDNFYVWDILIDDDEIEFYVQDTQTEQIVSSAVMKLSRTLGKTIDTTRYAAYGRLHNVAAPTLPPDLIISAMDVVTLDFVPNEPLASQMCTLGYGGETVPTTAAQSINWVNSTAPASATLSNTAAGYTTLGGNFQFVAVAGATTDYALFGFTVPAPYSFVCTGIDIETWNTGAAVATTPHLLQWFLSADQSAISLVTSTNRRIFVGAQSMAVGTPPGGMANSVARDLSNMPQITNPGRILVVGLRMPVATATASQIIQGSVLVRGYFR